MFDGETYDPTIDGHRLAGQWLAVWDAMSDGGWHTLADLHATTGCPEASISARLRDFRKARFGGHTVLRQRVSEDGGTWIYRLLPAAPIRHEPRFLPFDGATV